MVHFIWRILARIIALCLSLIFIFAAASKILHPEDFVRVVSAWKIIPSVVSPLVLIVVVFVEVVVALRLTFWPLRLKTYAETALVLLIFTSAYAVETFVSGGSKGCGCFAGLDHGWMITGRSLYTRNAALLLLILTGSGAVWLSRRSTLKSRLETENLSKEVPI